MSMPVVRPITASALGLAVAASLVACSSSSPATEESAAGTGTLTIANDHALATFDPSQADGNITLQYYQPVFDTLIRRTAEGEYVPMLATEWEYDDTNTTLSLDLRADVTFTDGAVFDAEAAAFNLLRTRDAGGDQSVTLASVEDVVAEDEDTISIRLSQPDPGLVDALSRTAGFMASPDSLESADVATVPVGSGPYVVDASQTVAGDTYVYTAREDYWDPSLQQYGTIVIRTLEDATARVNALKSGQINATKINIADIENVESAGFEVQTSDLSWSGILVYDRAGQVVPALGDARVRQAIAHALDRESLLTALRDGYGEVTDQFFGTESLAYLPELDDVYEYDPDEARGLLAEAGYPDGFELTIPDFSTIYGETLYAAVIQQLGDVGITVNRDQGGIPDLLSKINAQTYGLALFNYTSDAGWPTITTLILPDGSFNAFHSTDPTVESLLGEIRTSEGDAQVSAYQELNRHLVDEAWIVPLFRDALVYATDTNTTADLGSGVPPSIYDYAPAAS